MGDKKDERKQMGSLQEPPNRGVVKQKRGREMGVIGGKKKR